MDFTLIKTLKIWRVYNGNGTPQGYFFEHEKSLAQAAAQKVGGYIYPEKIYCFE